MIIYRGIKVARMSIITNQLQIQMFRWTFMIHGKNNFAEESKILLETVLKIILLDHQILKNNELCCKKFCYSNKFERFA